MLKFLTSETHRAANEPNIYMTMKYHMQNQNVIY